MDEVGTRTESLVHTIRNWQEGWRLKSRGRLSALFISDLREWMKRAQEEIHREHSRNADSPTGKRREIIVLLFAL
ncbi:hypothetical protein J6590_090623 [Homalodisca vitripennis]|nr:hypothetical protein J6590_090623 [Homalodisca vitripennis]